MRAAASAATTLLLASATATAVGSGGVRHEANRPSRFPSRGRTRRPPPPPAAPNRRATATIDSARSTQRRRPRSLPGGQSAVGFHFSREAYELGERLDLHLFHRAPAVDLHGLLA